MIHKTAIIDNKALIGNNVKIGPYSIVGPNVEIGDDTIIHTHVNITGNTKIGKKMRFIHFVQLEHHHKILNIKVKKIL